ncbi:MAG: molybdopterin-dependent oxidoreductase [Bdellovibrionales bacterium]|nr:molybdopterin-dependent oxidoreductase [Bdellovibrionales bacterium]
MAERSSGFNRRDFLKIIGAGTGMAAAGCAQELPEKIIPYVVQPDEVVPGVATWYAGSCGECSSGCGVLVRTREGRAVKVEGNPAHPISRGGLCSIGQSAVQGLYDPDRIREPLRREVGGTFKPVSWKEALEAIAEAMAAGGAAGKETVFLTNPLSGSVRKLVDEFTSKVPKASHVEYYSPDEAVQHAAAEQVFGPGAKVYYDFSLPKMIVSFGAGFLETWGSPVEYTKAYAAGRIPDAEGKVSRFVHVEPRLSLTAANADYWVCNAPGTEPAILQALLKLIVDAKGVGGEPAQAVRGVVVAKALAESGVSEAKLREIAEQLMKARNSVVLAGGAAVSGAHGTVAASLALLINVALRNIGTSVLVDRGQRTVPANANEPVQALLKRMGSDAQPVGVLFISGVNPQFVLPRQAGFASALGKAGLVVSMATNLDETARLANIVLPLSTNFEAWNDSEPQPGVFNLNQPSMQPLYRTQSFGDTIVQLAASEKINKPFEDIVSFEDYLKRTWRERTGAAGFDSRWLRYVEAGGEWSSRKRLDDALQPRSGAAAVVSTALQSTSAKAVAGLHLLAFPTVHLGDGAYANRPWMQEIPDPMTTAVWGSWVEVHPDAARAAGVQGGDVVKIVTQGGAIETPVYINQHLHPQVVAMPLGQGHEALGRYAAGVGVNPYAVAPLSESAWGPQLLFGSVDLVRSISKEELVILQGHDSQKGRGITRTVATAALAAGAGGHGDHGHGKGDHGHGKNGAHGADAHGHEGPSLEDFHLQHHDPLALGPHPEPKQMYRQMPHVEYRWGMSIDLAKCTGCSACVTACYAENNVPVVGKDLCSEGREMSWIRIERYFDGPEHRPVKAFQPMLCQHCGNAPCEPVCPVYATYHSDEGLNTMVYNRCVGTRYCSNNCSYKVRRFNWFDYEWAQPLNWQLNPDVNVRGVGVMEKCTFCIQRIREGQQVAKDAGRPVQDGEVVPACAATCPADAIVFGNLNDLNSGAAEGHRSPRSYKVLDAHINTQPAIAYLAKVVHEDGEAKVS